MVVSAVETSSIGEGASRKTVFNKKKQATFPFSDVIFFVCKSKLKLGLFAGFILFHTLAQPTGHIIDVNKKSYIVM